MFDPWVIHNNGTVPAMLTFRRIPSWFTTTKVYSISVFFSLEKQNCLWNQILAPFGSFFTGKKMVSRPLFSVFSLSRPRIFHGHIFQFFSRVRNILFQGRKFEFDNKAIIWGYKIVLVWKTGKFWFSPVILRVFFDFIPRGFHFHGHFFSIFSLVWFFLREKQRSKLSR